MNVRIHVLIAAIARVADVSPLAEYAASRALLSAIPSLLQGVGRPMPLSTEEAWRAAVAADDTVALRHIAVGFGAPNVGAPMGPHVSLALALLDALKPTYRCAGPSCPGLSYPASDIPHPPSCSKEKS